MTDNESLIIQQFEDKIHKLVSLYQSVRQNNSELQQAIESKDREIEALKATIASQEETYRNLKQSKVLEVSGYDLDDTKKRVSRLIGELDHCIEMLNY